MTTLRQLPVVSKVVIDKNRVFYIFIKVLKL